MVAVPTSGSVVPSLQLTVTWVTVLLLVTVHVAVTLCPTRAGFGDNAGLETVGTGPVVTVIRNGVLALPA